MLWLPDDGHWWSKVLENVLELCDLYRDRERKKSTPLREKKKLPGPSKGWRLVPKRSLKGFNSPYFLGLIGTPWKVFHKFLLSSGVRYLVFFHHFHLNSASCWWDSYWTLHPRGSRPSPHNVVRCAELSTLTNWNALFPHFHRSLTLACQPHASSQYSHRTCQSNWLRPHFFQDGHHSMPKILQHIDYSP